MRIDRHQEVIMEKRESRFSQFKSIKRSTIKLSPAELIKIGYFDEVEKFPLVMEPNVDNFNLIAWTKNNLAFIESELIKHGAILFRNFGINLVTQFEQFARTISPELLEYRERAAPRIEIANNIYTSTEFPANEWIPLHHEMSYCHNWPTKLWFLCLEPAQQGGRTPIANDRKVFKLIDPKIRQRFIEKRVMYIRNYGEGVDLSWQEAFQTDDKTLVEKYCHQTYTQFEWREGNRLRTRQIRQAVATHPKTDETVWFNHAHMFHISNLEQIVRKSLLAEFGEDQLPRNAFYGDGTPIEASILDEIREIYQQSAIFFSWQQGDILMLDNFLVSHGREPFVGSRKVLVAMAELYTNLANLT
ncbi:MAG: TauD/TfdA family dioxygenase [Acidobacteriota bacterium]